MPGQARSECCRRRAGISFPIRRDEVLRLKDFDLQLLRRIRDIAHPIIDIWLYRSVLVSLLFAKAKPFRDQPQRARRSLPRSHEPDCDKRHPGRMGLRSRDGWPKPTGAPRGTVWCVGILPGGARGSLDGPQGADWAAWPSSRCTVGGEVMVFGYVRAS